jgi:hypothetical protein
MKYIKFTYVDSITNISIKKEFSINGPKFPEIENLEFKWQNIYNYPIDVPEFYGTCNDSADINVEGILDVLTEEKYAQQYNQRFSNIKYLGPETVSAKQIRLRLLDLNLLDKVNTEINNLSQEMQIEWNYDTEFNINSDLINALRKIPEITDDIINQIYMTDKNYLYLKMQKQEEQELSKEDV